MDNTIISQLVTELQIAKKQIESVLQLSEEGNTVPFIARYRKEATGALDEVQIHAILERYRYILTLTEKKADYMRIISEKGKLTEELKNKFTNATKLQEIEDLYRPYKEKRKTRASIAKARGLEPLAAVLLGNTKVENFEAYVKTFINEALEVRSAEEALNGASDIVAEVVADDADLRKWLRTQFQRFAIMESMKKEKTEDEKETYRMYYEYSEAVRTIAPHRVLAINRGEKEDVLKVSLSFDESKAVAELCKRYCLLKNKNYHTYMENVLNDAYKRLLFPAIEREIRRELTEKAEQQAIEIFAGNVRNLFLQPPLKGKVVLGVDPAYRTGCKLAVVDDTGKLLRVGVIYPHTGKGNTANAESTFIDVVSTYKIEIIAIGNGTASRETEQFVIDTLKKANISVPYIIVNEAGASVYSASENARAEFPDLQVEERSAVSIARRVQDPLSELVKIDPKSVGVGQYQHDVSQKHMNESLQFVVETVVNNVGVNVNTASVELLQYVSGLSKTVAQNIVKERNEIGRFATRAQLKKIPRLGAKTYEQAIGFLRIIEGKNPFDVTSIHPEQYELAEKMLHALGLTIADIGTQKCLEATNAVDTKKLSEALGAGEYTIADILSDLQKPGRDPRDELPQPLLKHDVLSFADLKRGMELQGTVRNVVDFGVFVDIGVKQDGLVHKSKLKKGYVKHPMDVVSLGDIVTVWVDQVEEKQKRIALSMVPLD
ncbi:MAG: Tex family protein [Bacilli bacterium]